MSQPAAPDAPQRRSAEPTAWASPAGYLPPPAGYPAAAATSPAIGPTSAPGRRSNTLGLIALGLAVLATVGASLVAAIASYDIGLGAGSEISSRPIDADFDWSVLSPVRDWVLIGEVSFWAGTVIGVAALVLGVVAIVQNRGRGLAITAVVVAAVGPVAFGMVVQGFLGAGLGAAGG